MNDAPDQFELALQAKLSLAVSERFAFLVQKAAELTTIDSDPELIAGLEIIAQLTEFRGDIIRIVPEHAKPYKALLDELAGYKKAYSFDAEIARLRALVADFEGVRRKAQVAEAERLAKIAREKQKALLKEPDEKVAIGLMKESLAAQDAAFEAIRPTAGVQVKFKWEGEVTDWVRVATSNPHLLHPPALNRLALQDLINQLKARGTEITPDLLPGIRLSENTKITLR